MSEYTLGVVGQGFVGNAFREGMKDRFRIETYDKYVHERSTCKNIKELVDKSDIIFVSVPTPMRKTGECDLSIVDSVLQEIYDVECERWQGAASNIEVVIRSTVPPGSTEAFNAKYARRLTVLFNPEFLTEVNAVADFQNQDRIVLGFGSDFFDAVKVDTTTVFEVYRKAFPGVEIRAMYAAAAEMVKYTTNVFLATKVSLANELWQICRAMDVDYDVMIDAAKLDKRLGQSHWMVPGPPQIHDERRLFAWGGHCFPKDLNALISLAKSLDVKPTVMEAAWDKCLEMRPNPSDRDWEFMEGRAISKE